MAAMKPRLGVFTGYTHEGRKLYAVRKPCDYYDGDNVTPLGDQSCAPNAKLPKTMTFTLRRNSDNAVVFTCPIVQTTPGDGWYYSVASSSQLPCGVYSVAFGCSAALGHIGDWTFQANFADGSSGIIGYGKPDADFSVTMPATFSGPDATNSCTLTMMTATVTGTPYASGNDDDYVQTDVCSQAVQKQIFVKFTGDAAWIGGVYLKYNPALDSGPSGGSVGNKFWQWSGSIDNGGSLTATGITCEFPGNSNFLIVSVDGTGSASFPIFAGGGGGGGPILTCSPRATAVCSGVPEFGFITWGANVDAATKASDGTGGDGERGFDRLGLKVGPYSIHEGRKLFATIDCNPISPSGGGTPKLYRMGVYTGLHHKGRRLFAVENDQCCDGGAPADADGPDPDPPSTPADQQMLVGCAFCALVPKYIKILIKQAYPPGTFTFAPFWVVGTWDGYQYTVPSQTSPDGRLGFSVNFICGGAVPPFYSYCDPARPTYCNVWMANGSIFYNPILFGVVFACCTYDNQYTPTWACDPFGFNVLLYGGIVNCTASML